MFDTNAAQRRVSRRQILKKGALWLCAVAFPSIRAGLAGASTPPRPGPPSKALLSSSPLVYVSPLRSDGSESRCHGEVWFFRDGEDVVLATSKDSWKARALDQGFDRARIWVGDFGSYRAAKGRVAGAPRFDARAELDNDPAAFKRLIDAYARKYPSAWVSWKPRFESGFQNGSRLMIRYRPIVGLPKR